MKYKITLLIVFAVCFCCCERDTITETEIGKIASTFLIYLGDEYVGVDLYEMELVDKGICYSEKTATPTINDNRTDIPYCSNDGTYIVKLDHVKEGVTYAYRVFIKKEDAVVYGEVKSFTMAKTAQGWLQKANFPGSERRHAVGFSIGSKGYIGLGSDISSDNFKDFWEYNPFFNSWTQKASFEPHTRGQVTGFSIGNKGYIVNSYNENNFWEFEPVTNRWTKKADFPGLVRAAAVGFAIGNKGYVGTGRYVFSINTDHNDFWEYDPATDQWTKKADFPGGPRYSAVGFSIGDKGYVGAGCVDPNFGNKKDFWEYNPAINQWTRIADFPDQTNNCAIGFSIENKGYVGIDCSGDFWEYDPITNKWTRRADFPGKSKGNAAGFVIANKGYIGTGGFDDFPNMRDFWEFKP